MIATQSGIEFDSITYRRESGRYRFEYDRDATAPSMAVVAALSEVMETDPTTAEPLQASIDTDSLDALLCVEDTAVGDVHVSWSHDDYTIGVHSDGVVTVDQAQET